MKSRFWKHKTLHESSLHWCCILHSIVKFHENMYLTACLGSEMTVLRLCSDLKGKICSFLLCSSFFKTWCTCHRFCARPARYRSIYCTVITPQPSPRWLYNDISQSCYSPIQKLMSCRSARRKLIAATEPSVMPMEAVWKNQGETFPCSPLAMVTAHS